MQRYCIMKSSKNRILPVIKPCVLKPWERAWRSSTFVNKIWEAKPVGLQVYQILSAGEFEDAKMIGNRSAAIGGGEWPRAFRGGDEPGPFLCPGRAAPGRRRPARRKLGPHYFGNR